MSDPESMIMGMGLEFVSLMNTVGSVALAPRNEHPAGRAMYFFSSIILSSPFCVCAIYDNLSMSCAS